MVDKILFSSGEADITTQGVRVLERVGKVLNRRIEIALLPDLRELPGAAKSGARE
jgi:hypothetical protein